MNKNKTNENKIHNPKARQFKEMFRRLSENKLALAGGIITVLLILMALTANWITPFDPTEQDYSKVLQPPSAEHWFGTDDIGRDLFSRVILGTQVSLKAGLFSVGIALALGVPIGLISGYRRGFLDEVIIMRITDAMLSFPALVLALAFAAVLGAGLGNVMIAIGLVYTPNFIRLTRAEVLAQREREYVLASRSSGLRDWRILLYHILPNSLAPILIQATLSVASAIIAEASLSYLGLGTQPPTPSWGAMLSTGQSYLSEAPWLALFPGAFIFLTVMAINLFGDGIRDAFDTKL